MPAFDCVKVSRYVAIASCFVFYCEAVILVCPAIQKRQHLSQLIHTPPIRQKQNCSPVSPKSLISKTFNHRMH